MEYSLRYSARAAKQLASLERYLAHRFYPGNAALFIERIKARCNRLLLAPTQGRICDELRPGLRITGMEDRVTIAYRIDGATVRIVAIAYGGRQIDTAL
jgi:plasmid stabilization system protein ParE